MKSSDIASIAAPEVKCEALSGTIGAELSGIDLSRDVDESTLGVIRNVLKERLVVAIRGNQPVDPDQLVRFMQRFGELDAEPFAGTFRFPNVNGNPYIFGFIKEATDSKLNLGGFWHADVTCRPRPHKYAMLYCAEAPSAGGDTMFANQYLALESLSQGMRDMLSGLQGVHSSAMTYGREGPRMASASLNHAPIRENATFSTESYDASANFELEETLHPVVRTHPDTGRQHLFINRAFTERFDGMTREESEPLLEFLWNHAARPEFTCRVRWTPYTAVIFDNRCVQHYALNDYFGERREMYRVAVHDDVV